MPPAVPPVALDQPAGSFLRGQARPGDQERPAARLVHAFGGKVTEFLARWQAELEAGSDQPEPEKRPVINEHGLLFRFLTPQSPACDR